MQSLLSFSMDLNMPLAHAHDHKFMQLNRTCNYLFNARVELDKS